jgi:hypothetical protein
MEATNAAVLNFGGSGLLPAVALEYCEKKGYFWGRYQGMALLGAVPYSRRLVGLSLFGLTERNSESATLLTNLVLGKSRSGVGTCTVADLYLDLGIWGVLIGHLAVGCAAASIQCKYNANPGSVTTSVLYFFSLGAFSIMARYGAMGYFVREIGYPVALCWALTTVCACQQRVFVRSAQLGDWKNGMHRMADDRL